MAKDNIKQIRGQVRQIVKEILPEVLTLEIAVTIQKALMQELGRRLDAIDQRQKDIQAFTVRQASPVQVKGEDK